MSTPTRRQFLATSAAVALSSSASALARPTSNRIAPTADSVIFLLLTGGPSQLDTWDPKEHAPSQIRGPFRPISTAVPGVKVSELFPQMAKLANKFALVRGVHHDAAPIHETGLQMIQTGRLFRDGPEWPSLGCVHSFLNPDLSAQGIRRHYVAPNPSVETGIRVGKGFGPGFLKDRVEFWSEGTNVSEDSLTYFDERGLVNEEYGRTAFGQNCWRAVNSVAKCPGRFIQVNQFSTVFDAPSWDCHADGGSLACSLRDYQETVAPSFDLAFSRLIEDLETRGLLERTLVVATGEFGRTPKLNSNGGRDHWAGCWTSILAGGGVRGGQVIGASDATGSEPKDRPVHATDLVATIAHALGISSTATIPGPNASPAPVYLGQPVVELF